MPPNTRARCGSLAVLGVEHKTLNSLHDGIASRGAYDSACSAELGSAPRFLERCGGPLRVAVGRGTHRHSLLPLCLVALVGVLIWRFIRWNWRYSSAPRTKNPLSTLTAGRCASVLMTCVFVSLLQLIKPTLRFKRADVHVCPRSPFWAESVGAIPHVQNHPLPAVSGKIIPFFDVRAGKVSPL